MNTNKPSLLVSCAKQALKITACVLIVCVINLFVPVRLLPPISSAQTNSPEQTFLFQNLQNYTPTNFSVLDRDLGKTVVFNSTSSGFNYAFEDDPGNLGMIQQTSLVDTSMTLTENDLLKPASNGSERRNISVRISIPRPNGNVQQGIITGILEDGGTANDSKLTAQITQVDGTIVKNVTINIPRQQIENMSPAPENVIVIILAGMAILALVAGAVWCQVIANECIQACANACTFGVRRVTSWCGFKCQCDCNDRPQDGGGVGGNGHTPIQN